jgi:hypothetical protein
MISQSIPILRINEIPYCTWKECLQIDVMFLRKVFIFQSCNHRKSMTYRQNYVRIMSERTKYEKTNNGPLSNIWTLQIDGELHKRSRRVIGSCSNIYTRRVNHVKISWFIVHVCTENQNKTFHYRKDCSKGLS